MFEGHLLFEGPIEPASPGLYLHHIRQRALERVERDLLESMDGIVFYALCGEAEMVYFSRTEIRV